MKLIGYLNAVAAMRETIEEYAPEKGVVQAEMIDLVKATFSFRHAPQNIPPGITLPMLYAAGKYKDDAEEFGIAQLVMEPNGDVVVATTTDQAEKALDLLIRTLDNKLGFRLSASNKRKFFVSNLVVEFEGDFSSHIDKLGRITDLINANRPNLPDFALKRLGFGYAPVGNARDQTTMAETADFVIERRAQQPLESNRYYCSAPMQTQVHLRVLREIEQLVIAA